MKVIRFLAVLFCALALAPALAHLLELPNKMRRLSGPKRRGFAAALIAFLCIAATQIVFWAFTFPMNQQTANWTMMPDHWEAMRRQWEYSQATSAVFNLIALVSAIIASISGGPRRD